MYWSADAFASQTVTIDDARRRDQHVAVTGMSPIDRPSPLHRFFSLIRYRAAAPVAAFRVISRTRCARGHQRPYPAEEVLPCSSDSDLQIECRSGEEAGTRQANT